MLLVSSTRAISPYSDEVGRLFRFFFSPILRMFAGDDEWNRTGLVG